MTGQVAPSATRRAGAPLPVQLGLLATATFVYVTFEVLPVGLIGDISADLHVSSGRIGLLISGYAVVAGVLTIPSVRLAARWQRKQALLASLAVLVLAEVVGAVATNYPLLAVSRVLAALTHGVLWSLVAPVAASLVPPARVGMATSAVFAGATAAAVAGTPLTTVVGDAFGWRMAVVVLAVLSAATLLGLAVTLPGGAQSDPAPSEREGRPSDRRLRGIYLLAVIVVFAQFLSYTYFSPLVGRVVSHSGAVAAFLALFGAAGAVATYLMGRHSDAAPARAAVAAVAAIAVGTGGVALGWFPLATWLAVAVLTVAVVLWGAGYAGIGPSFQAALIRLAADRADRASAVYVTCYQVGIALGSAVGALVVGPALSALPVASCAAALVATAVTVRLRNTLFDAS